MFGIEYECKTRPRLRVDEEKRERGARVAKAGM